MYSSQTVVSISATSDGSIAASARRPVLPHLARLRVPGRIGVPRQCSLHLGGGHAAFLLVELLLVELLLYGEWR